MWLTKANLVFLFIIVLWVVAISCGYTMVIHYGLKPSSALNNLSSWPSQSELKLDRQLNTLVVFIHPKCPCSRATLVELDRLLVNSNHNLKVITVFINPEAKNINWYKTDLWDRAGALAGVERYVDGANQEATAFHASTSGEVYLFKPNGELVYHGGITAARGHEGDSVGRSLISSYIRTGTIKEHQGYAYGCSL